MTNPHGRNQAQEEALARLAAGGKLDIDGLVRMLEAAATPEEESFVAGLGFTSEETFQSVQSSIPDSTTTSTTESWLSPNTDQHREPRLQVGSRGNTAPWQTFDKEGAKLKAARKHLIQQTNQPANYTTSDLLDEIGNIGDDEFDSDDVYSVGGDNDGSDTADNDATQTPQSGSSGWVAGRSRSRNDGSSRRFGGDHRKGT